MKSFARMSVIRFLQFIQKNNNKARPFLAIMAISGCVAFQQPSPETTATLRTTNIPTSSIQETQTPKPERTAHKTTALPSPGHTPGETATPIATATAETSGPDCYPAGINPLSGLPVGEPDLLKLPPALVSVSNSPVTTRPQAGLSFSPMVFEIYLGEGDSRFLAVFYGEYPSLPPDSDIEEAYIGPIRSGRLPYEKLRQLFNGYLVFAGASDRVLPYLNEYVVVYNPDLYNINGGAITSQEAEENARQRQADLGEADFSGLLFDPQPPEGGKKASSLWAAFHYHDQVFWRYDEKSHAYLRYQNTGEGTPLEVFYDRLNDEILTYENVIVLFADYSRYTEIYFDIDLMYIKRYPALLFRDGKMYEIYWTTRNQEYEINTGRLRPMRFVDYDYNPIPLKPGQTWVEIMQVHSPYYETIESENYHQLSTISDPGSGHWAVNFYHEDYIGDPQELEE